VKPEQTPGVGGTSYEHTIRADVAGFSDADGRAPLISTLGAKGKTRQPIGDYRRRTDGPLWSLTNQPLQGSQSAAPVGDLRLHLFQIARTCSCRAHRHGACPVPATSTKCLAKLLKPRDGKGDKDFILIRTIGIAGRSMISADFSDLRMPLLDFGEQIIAKISETMPERPLSQIGNGESGR